MSGFFNTLRLTAMVILLSHVSTVPLSAAPYTGTSQSFGYRELASFWPEDSPGEVALVQPYRSATAFHGIVAGRNGRTILLAAETDTGTGAVTTGTAKYELFVASGALTSRSYPVARIGSRSVRVDLDGGRSLEGLVSGDEVILLRSWTVGDFFVKGDAVELSLVRDKPRSLVILPDWNWTGVNPPQAGAYLKLPSRGMVDSATGQSAGEESISCGSYLILRHPYPIGPLRLMGWKNYDGAAVELKTRPDGRQDNLVGFLSTEPVNLLAPGSLPAAFEPTTNPANIRDILLRHDPTGESTRLAPSEGYIHLNGTWTKLSDGLPATELTIRPGEGFIIRKAPSLDGAPVYLKPVAP